MPPAFDRRLDLETLLAVLSPARLAAALGGLCGAAFCLRDDAGQIVIAGPAWSGGDATCAPLQCQLEEIGQVCVAAGAPLAAQAVAPLLEVLLQAAARYHMAADLHVEAVQEDYRLLLEKHAQLAQSEARYRELAAELEQRVREQVATIERAQRQLFQAEKLASVGQLAAGMAHEINNPIGYIRSNLSTAQDYVRRLAQFAKAVPGGDGAALAAAWRRADLDFALEDFAALLEESIAGADRVGRIVADLKAFSSVDCAGEATVDLNDNLRHVANVALAQLGDTTRLALDLQPLPPLRCSPAKLNQVFLSLVQNAAQAIAPAGEIRIDSACAGGAIRVRVRDDGAGMTPELLSRAFDPFFTTRGVGQGTGLGLTVSRDIVTAHGGTIDISSAPGRGTTVTVRLPLADQPIKGRTSD